MSYWLFLVVYMFVGLVFGLIYYKHNTAETKSLWGGAKTLAIFSLAWPLMLLV